MNRHRWTWAALLAIVLATIAMLILARIDANSQGSTVCVSEEERDRIKKLSLEAIDNSFRDHIEHLFEIWVRDSASQPARAKVGAKNGISAHIRARRDAENWLPLICH